MSLSFFTACEPTDDTVDANEATYYLCQTHWDSSFTNTNGVECEQEFLFDKDGTGVEFFTTYNPGHTYTEKYSFYWNWTSGYFNAIAIEYGSDDRVYFDNVVVGADFLTGYLDGDYAEFHPY